MTDTTKPETTWRLLLTGPADGETNMAVDQAILEAVGAGRVPPTLRFYAWDPPCISLGRSQTLADLDLDRCQREGIGWVQRPTGGRAILHTDEITYSVALPRRHPLVQGSLIESYRRLSQGLLAGFRHLGLPVIQAALQEPPAHEGSPACFDRPSHYEITCQGRKLVGSAQVRRRDAVLQHGSIPLRGDLTRLIRYLNLSADEKQQLRQILRRRAITLAEALGWEPQEEEVVSALIHGFSQALGLRLEPGQLTPEEKRQAVAPGQGRPRRQWTWLSEPAL